MRSPSSRRANPWTDIQTGLHPVMSSRAVLAQDLGDGLSPYLKGMRAARLWQISPDSPERQLLAPCRAEPCYFSYLPKSACLLSSPKRGMCNGLLKCACNLKYSYANHPGGQHDRSCPASLVQTGLPSHCLGPVCLHLDKASSLQAAQASLWLQSIFLRAAQFKALEIKMK